MQVTLNYEIIWLKLLYIIVFRSELQRLYRYSLSPLLRNSMAIPKFTSPWWMLFRSHINILVDSFYIFTYFVWWGDFIFRRLLNSVWLLAVKWENKKTSHPKLGQHVCCHLCLLHMGYILVFWVQATFWERWCRHIFGGGWREGLEAECIYTNGILNRRVIFTLDYQTIKYK